MGFGQSNHPGAWAAFAALLAMAGLPIYIHAPKVYADTYGVGLGALGVVLFGLRLLDFVQDPALGWLARVTAPQRKLAFAIGLVILALSMLGLFAVTPPVAPLLWFALMMTGLFSAFSFLTIIFYAEGVSRAKTLEHDGHVRLAAWRETGALIGVCVAAVAPTLLAFGPNPPLESFAILFAAFALAAGWIMRNNWRGTRPENQAFVADFSVVVRDRVARRLLMLAFLNALPVAITSTLFLFFVESRLAAPGWEGPLLLAFFLAAAVSAPLWAMAAQIWGARTILLYSMAASILAFGGSALLGAGDAPTFLVFCLTSGATLGAELTLLSALFARRLETILPEATAGFAMWSFVNKSTLALAAVSVLPFLDWMGFEGPDSGASALLALTLTYALLPCVLKLVALALLAATDVESE